MWPIRVDTPCIAPYSFMRTVMHDIGPGRTMWDQGPELFFARTSNPNQPGIATLESMTADGNQTMMSFRLNAPGASLCRRGGN
jgi:hypothetical protein